MKRRHFPAIFLSAFGMTFLISVVSVNAYEFPPYEGLSLKVEGKVAESYSNNVTYASEDEDRVEDLITNFSVGAGLKYERERRALELRGQLNRQIITDTGDLENSSERATAIFWNEFSRYDRITISNTYIHTEVPGTIDEGLNRQQCENLFDLFGRELVVRLYPECGRFEEEFGRVAGRFDSFRNTVNVTYRRDLGERFNISTDYVFDQRWSPEEGANDSDRNIGRVRLRYGLSAATFLSLSYSYENTRYESGTDIDIQRVRAGIRQYITQLLYVDLTAGTDYSSTISDNFNVEASLAGELDKKTAMRITYARDEETSSETEDIFRNWRVSGIVTRQLLEDLFVNLSGFYGQGDFVSAEVTDTFLGAGFNISYIFWRDKFGKSVDGRLGYTYSDLDSTDAERGYSRIGLDAGLTVSF